MSDQSIVEPRSERRVARRRLLKRCAIFFGIAWLIAFVLANVYAPHLRDSRWPFKTYAAIAMYVRTTQFHVGVLALAMAAFCAAKKRRRGATMLAIVGACAVAQEVRHAWPKRDVLPADGVPLRVVALNNYRLAENADRVAAMVREQVPDLIAFSEFRDACDAQLAASIGDVYPHRVAYPLPRLRGVAIYSRWPIVETRPLVGGVGFERFFESTIDVRGQHVRVIVAHFTSPQSVNSIWMNRVAVDECIRVVNAKPNVPTIVAGDMNFAFHSQQADAFRAGGLAHADDRAGRGLRWTWMPKGVLPALTRIDHVFLTPDLAVADSGVLPDVGSDHRPIVVDLRVR